MILKNGYVYGEDCCFAKRDLYVENGRIVPDASSLTNVEEIDASGLYVIPGLIDIHSHGACGCDFSDADPKGLQTILEYEYAHGITSYCPTSMTLPKEQLERIFLSAGQEVEAAAQSGTKHSRILGFNMEGPFLQAKKKGAHQEIYIRKPDVAFFRFCQESSGGRLRLVTLAPDTEGALDFIRQLHDEVTISLGHTAADYETSRLALEAGASHVTHLYNAMPPFAHRQPGLIGAAADDPGCMAELICDGIHIHESAVRAAFKLFPGRMILISDSMRATGLQDGTYDLGGQQVIVKGRLAALADGTIAGSATNLFDCMRTAISFGIAPETAIACATANPAKSIGMYDSVGSLTPGKYADILLLDREYRLVRVL